MPILHESEDEIVIGPVWRLPVGLRWLLRPTRIVFDKKNGVIRWRGVLTWQACCAKDDWRVEVVSSFGDEREPNSHDVSIVMPDMKRLRVANDKSLGAIRAVAERINNFASGEVRHVSYRMDIVGRGGD